jgi:hypothetical protein
METGENVVKVRTLVRMDHHLGISMVIEELNMDKDTVRQILTTNLNVKEACAKMISKNLPVFSQRTNTNAQACSILTRSCPHVTSFSYQN